MPSDGPDPIPEIPETTPEVEELLALKVVRRAVRLLMIPVVLLVAVAGVFGIDLANRLANAREELMAAHDTLLEVTLPEAERRAASLQALQGQLSALLDDQRAQAEQQSQLLTRQLAQLTQQAQSLGGALVRIDAAESSVTALDEGVRNTSQETEQLLDSLRRGLVRLDSTAAEIEGIRAQITEQLVLIEQRVFGSWSFVVHENRRSDLAPLPLTVRLGNIDDDVLEEFEVVSSGIPLESPSPLRVGETRCIELEERVTSDTTTTWFRLTPNYIVELFLGDDISGLQVQRVPDRGRCMAGTLGS